MGFGINEWKKSSGVVWVFLVFLTVGATGFGYLYKKEPVFNISVSINVAIASLSVCGFTALILFLISLKKLKHNAVRLSHTRS